MFFFAWNVTDGGYTEKKQKTSPEKKEHVFRKKEGALEDFFWPVEKMAPPFFLNGGNMSSFLGFNFHQVRSKKSVATAVSTRDSQGGVRNWLVETRGSVGNSHGKV